MDFTTLCDKTILFVRELARLKREQGAMPQLSPDNVLVSAEGITLRDAAPVSDAVRALTVYPGFSAPETHRGCINESADVYFTGALLASLLTGRTPVAAPSRELAPAPLVAGPGPLAEIANRATALQPRDRYATLDELEKALEKAKSNFAGNAASPAAPIHAVSTPVNGTGEGGSANQQPPISVAGDGLRVNQPGGDTSGFPYGAPASPPVFPAPAANQPGYASPPQGPSPQMPAAGGKPNPYNNPPVPPAAPGTSVSPPYGRNGMSPPPSPGQSGEGTFAYRPAGPVNSAAYPQGAATPGYSAPYAGQHPGYGSPVAPATGGYGSMPRPGYSAPPTGYSPPQNYQRPYDTAPVYPPPPVMAAARKPRSKKAKVIIIVALALAALLLAFGGYTVLRYTGADSALQSGNYAAAWKHLEATPWLRLVEPKMFEYARARSLLAAGHNGEALLVLDTLGNYRDADGLVQSIRYEQAVAQMEAGRLEESLALLEQVEEYKDSQELAGRIRQYLMAEATSSAVEKYYLFSDLGNFLDSAQRAEKAEAGVMESALKAYRSKRFEEAFTAFAALEDSKEAKQYARLCELWDAAATTIDRRDLLPEVKDMATTVDAGPVLMSNEFFVVFIEGVWRSADGGGVMDIGRSDFDLSVLPLPDGSYSFRDQAISLGSTEYYRFEYRSYDEIAVTSVENGTVYIFTRQ